MKSFEKHSFLLPGACTKTFKYQSETYPTEHNPAALVMRDFNQDSYVDLAIINADSDSFSILLGNGNGTFQEQRAYPTGNGSNPRKLAVGDLNDDGLWDLGESRFIQDHQK